ncbi:sugar phosphate nucleotidyltransferase [Marinilabiliaceae bacterium ANBcel2]|nr:sugar phosphate nucleotidyltransferase [Marinilabiliaceae bacterium ANBcel2]
MGQTLLVLAAGMGSRYGGLKQMDELGPSGETIIDYSIYDAIRAGFDKVVFVIRDSFKDAFIERFESKLKGKIKTEYVFQELDKLPQGFTVPEGREKPWGTGHAMLMAKEVIDTPFAVINADDFYGEKAYMQASQFIKESSSANEYAMIGYLLKNTLSKHGTVSRGVCQVDDNNNLTDIVERTKIGTENSKIYYYEGDSKTELTGNEAVSMNFWIFKPQFMNHLQSEFENFLKEKGSELKSEFYFNSVADKLIKKEKGITKVINTDAKWFGITYKEDKPIVKKELNSLIEQGDYPKKLW